MIIYVAESHDSLSLMELLTGKVGEFQTKIDANFFRMTKRFEDADAVLVPHDAYDFYKFPEYLTYLNNLALVKPIIYSDRGDFPKNPRIANSIALRVAVNPGESLRNKVVVPYNIESLEGLPYRAYAERPTVSFMGFIPKISPGRIYRTLKYSPCHPISGNGAAVRKITRSRIYQSNLDYEFISRSSYGASFKLTHDLDVKRREYLQQISSSDFIIAPRGDANQSTRFYESLSAGRIPLVPNTSFSLPKSLDTLSPIEYPFVGFSLLKGSIHKPIESYWLNFSTGSEYIKSQVATREFFAKNLAFNTFMKRLFSLQIRDFFALSEFYSR